MKGPWYITPSAVRDYLQIRGWPERAYDEALENLIEIAQETVSEGKQPTELDNDHLRYRTGRKYGRMGLVVSHVPRTEGDLPQLIAVTRSA